MNLTSKLTTFALCLTLFSCGEKKTEDTVETEAKAAQEAISHESAYADLVSELEKMMDVVANIKDLESAKAAIPSLTKLSFKMKMIRTDLEKLGPASKDLAAKLEKDYGPKMEEMKSNIGQKMEELKTAHPDAFGMIDKVMKTIME